MSNTDIALALLQMIALAIPPVAVLVKMLRKSDNIKWRTRQFSFLLAAGSILSFLGGEAAVLLYFFDNLNLPFLLRLAMVLILAALVPFALFMGVLYREHQLEYA